MYLRMEVRRELVQARTLCCTKSDYDPGNVFCLYINTHNLGSNITVL